MTIKKESRPEPSFFMDNESYSFTFSSNFFTPHLTAYQLMIMVRGYVKNKRISGKYIA